MCQREKGDIKRGRGKEGKYETRERKSQFEKRDGERRAILRGAILKEGGGERGTITRRER